VCGCVCHSVWCGVVWVCGCDVCVVVMCTRLGCVWFFVCGDVC